MAPDVFVVEDPMRGNYKVREGGKGPDFVPEVASPNTWREDVETKPGVYARLGVREYFLHETRAVAERVRVCLQALWRLERTIHQGTVAAVEAEGLAAMASRFAPQWKVHHTVLRSQLRKATARGKRWRLLIQVGGWPSPIEIDPAMLGEDVTPAEADDYVLARFREGAARAFGVRAPVHSVWTFPAPAQRSPVSTAVAAAMAVHAGAGGGCLTFNDAGAVAGTTAAEPWENFIMQSQSSTQAEDGTGGAFREEVLARLDELTAVEEARVEAAKRTAVAAEIHVRCFPSAGASDWAVLGAGATSHQCSIGAGEHTVQARAAFSGNVYSHVEEVRFTRPLGALGTYGAYGGDGVLVGVPAGALATGAEAFQYRTEGGEWSI